MRSQDEAGQIIGAEVHDELDAWGKPIPVHARVVINAGGPFSDSIRKMADEEVPANLKRTSIACNPTPC
jgi:glycerol-3-phosphate dehydrogenase